MVTVNGAILVDGDRHINLNKSKSWWVDPTNPNEFYVDGDRFNAGVAVATIATDIDLAMQNAGGGGGGGGGAVTAVDGAINTLGGRANQAAANPTGTTDSLMSVVKGLWTSFITAFGTRRTLSSAALTADGSIPAGSLTVVIETSTDFAGTIAGGTVAGQRFFSFSEPGGLAAIAVTRTAGTLTYWRTA